MFTAGHGQCATLISTGFIFAQTDSQAAIIDERYNHGGAIADYIIDLLGRPLRNCAITREGDKWCSRFSKFTARKRWSSMKWPVRARRAPWMFRQEKLGPLVGTRTGVDSLASAAIRRFSMAAVSGATRGNLRITRRNGKVENHGHRAGHRSRKRSRFRRRRPRRASLKKAVQVTLDALKKNLCDSAIIRLSEYHQKM